MQNGTLIMNGAQSDDDTASQVCGIIARLLSDSGWETTVVTLEDMTVEGCGSGPDSDCRTCGTGLCGPFADRLRTLFLASGLTVIVTPLRTGVYSYHVKKALDLLIPLYSSTVHRDEGRYRLTKSDTPYPALFVTGIAAEPDDTCASLFHTLTERIAHSLHAPDHDAVILYRHDSRDRWRQNLAPILPVFPRSATGGQL